MADAKPQSTGTKTKRSQSEAEDTPQLPKRGESPDMVRSKRTGMPEPGQTYESRNGNTITRN